MVVMASRRHCNGYYRRGDEQYAVDMHREGTGKNKDWRAAEGPECPSSKLGRTSTSITMICFHRLVIGPNNSYTGDGPSIPPNYGLPDLSTTRVMAHHDPCRICIVCSAIGEVRNATHLHCNGLEPPGSMPSSIICRSLLGRVIILIIHFWRGTAFLLYILP